MRCSAATKDSTGHATEPAIETISVHEIVESWTEVNASEAWFVGDAGIVAEESALCFQCFQNNRLKSAIWFNQFQVSSMRIVDWRKAILDAIR